MDVAIERRNHMRAWPYRIHVDSMAIKAYDDKDTVDLEGWMEWIGCFASK